MENYNQNYLQHFGIKDMKWGVRRYQNKDGSLTDAGKKRYARDAREKEFNKYDQESGVYYKESKKNGRSDLQVDANRYVKEDMQRSKNVIDRSAELSRNLRKASDNDYKRRSQSRERLDLTGISDKELRDQINRELLERQYNDVFNQPQISKGRERVNKVLDVGGDVLVVAGSVVALAVGIKELIGDK